MFVITEFDCNSISILASQSVSYSRLHRKSDLQSLKRKSKDKAKKKLCGNTQNVLGKILKIFVTFRCFQKAVIHRKFYIFLQQWTSTFNDISWGHPSAAKITYSLKILRFWGLKDTKILQIYLKTFCQFSPKWPQIFLRKILKIFVTFRCFQKSITY